MYVIDFLKNLFKKGNIGTIIWMIFNFIFIGTVFAGMGYFLGATDAGGIVLFIGIGIAVYALSVVIALSMLGEHILRFQCGCKKITDQAVLNRIQPIFNEVYARAKRLNPELPNNIELFISEDKTINAYALGRHSVCITYGLLQLSDNDIRGILGHEFGHLAHKDTDMLTVITVGNTIVSILFFLIKMFAKIMIFFFRVILQITVGMVTRSLAANIITWISGAITKVIIDGLLAVLMYLWTLLGVLICNASSRANEYMADGYSLSLGYGRLLVNALNNLPRSSSGSKMSLFALLSSTHPDTSDRIARLSASLNNLTAY